MLVLFEAVAVYITLPFAWHLKELVPNAKVGVPTLAVVVTVCVAVFGPLQPVAVAVIVEVPLQVAVKLTSPVAVFMVFPANILVASSM